MNVRLLTALVLAATPTLAHAAEPAEDTPATELHDDGSTSAPTRTRFEISVTSELHWLVHSSARVSSAASSQGSFFVGFGYSPAEMVDVYVGYRSLYETTRGDKGYTLGTDGDAAVLGARLRYPLLSWLGVIGGLDVEALHLEHELAVNGRSGSTGEWTFGVAPRAGVELTLDFGGAAGVLRIEGGYAFRGAAPVSLTLSSDASEVDPVDLGTVDLSGPVFGLSLGIRF